VLEEVVEGFGSIVKPKWCIGIHNDEGESCAGQKSKRN
jgi:hypothetical protein